MKSRYGSMFSTSSSKLLAGIVYALAMSGCGDADSPADVDAQVPMTDAMTMTDAMDVCSCQSAGALAERITHRLFDSEGSPVTGHGVACSYPEIMLDYGKLLGGGGVLYPESTEDEAALTDLGVEFAEIPLLGEQELHWWARLQADSSNPNRLMDIGAVCIDTSLDSGSEPARQFDVSHTVTYAAIPPDGVLDTSARCTRGMLIGGGCSTDPIPGTHARLLSAGMDPADENAWLCSWRSQNTLEDIDVAAHAYCLEETVPEECDCPPLTDVVTVKRETLPLGPGRSQVQASCAEGELLLLGNCMLDVADSASLRNITMLGSSFSPEGKTWDCSWNNPDAVPATAIATALCIAK